MRNTNKLWQKHKKKEENYFVQFFIYLLEAL